MRILNVWLAADNRKTKRSELKKFTPKVGQAVNAMCVSAVVDYCPLIKVRGMKPAYSEHEERHWMYMRMVSVYRRHVPDYKIIIPSISAGLNND
jgi:hypothetical protein